MNIGHTDNAISGNRTHWTHEDWTHNTEACEVGPIWHSKIALVNVSD